MSVIRISMNLRNSKIQIYNYTTNRYQSMNQNTKNIKSVNEDQNWLQKMNFQQIAKSQESIKRVVEDLITKSLPYLQLEQDRHAYQLLKRAQNVLEIGASNGKAIERSIINCTLHNLAVYYQNNQEFHKETRYIDAIIHNLQSYLSSIKVSRQDASFQTNKCKNYFCSKTKLNSYPKNKKSQEKIFYMDVKTKDQIGKYYLQLCANYSMAGVTKQALSSAKNGLIFIKQYFKAVYTQFLKLNKLTEEQIEETKMNNKKILFWLIQQLSSISQQRIRVQNFQEILKITNKLLAQRKSNKNQMKFLLQGCKLQLSDYTSKQIQKEAIGGIMRLLPKQIVQFKKIQQQTLQNESHQEHLIAKFINKVVQWAVSYFSIGNELRKINILRCGSKQQEIESGQYKQSKMYHLFGIIFLSLYSPCETLVLNQMIQTYANFYGEQIQLSFHKDVEIRLQNLFQFKSIKERSLSKPPKSMSKQKIMFQYSQKQKTRRLSPQNRNPLHIKSTNKMRNSMKNTALNTKKSIQRGKLNNSKSKSLHGQTSSRPKSKNNRLIIKKQFQKHQNVYQSQKKSKQKKEKSKSSSIKSQMAKSYTNIDSFNNKISPNLTATQSKFEPRFDSCLMLIKKNDKKKILDKGSRQLHKKSQKYLKYVETHQKKVQQQYDYIKTKTHKRKKDKRTFSSSSQSSLLSKKNKSKDKNYLLGSKNCNKGNLSPSLSCKKKIITYYH